MINSEMLGQLFDCLESWIISWERKTHIQMNHNDPLVNLIYEVHRSNYLLWNEEDKVRRTDLDDSMIVRIKRQVDQLNQKRNDLIERVDEWLLEHHYNHLIHHDLPIRTETPGSALDRLSVLSLKIYHMTKQTERTDVGNEHIEACRERLSILLTQWRDLEGALSNMISELNAEKIRMKVYRQFKMYNDPNLNPQLYVRKDSGKKA